MVLKPKILFKTSSSAAAECKPHRKARACIINTLLLIEKLSRLEENYSPSDTQ